MITPTSAGDWAQALGMSGLSVAAAWWFARALREGTSLEPVGEREDDARELVGTGVGDARQ